MNKMKSNRSMRKRFRVTAKGRLKKSKAGRRHLLTKKTKKRKRNMRRASLVSKAQEKMYKYLIQA